jgi:hypothetical protein
MAADFLETYQLQNTNPRKWQSPETEMLVKNRLPKCYSNFRAEKLPKTDSTDGLAAAVCHFFNSGKVIGEKSYTGLGCFVKKMKKRSKNSHTMFS